jgi:hypothetical protein
MQDNSSDTTLNRSRMTVADFVSSRLHGSLYAWRSGSGFLRPNPCGRHRQITANHDVDVRLNDGERVREVSVDFFSL